MTDKLEPKKGNEIRPPENDIKKGNQSSSPPPKVSKPTKPVDKPKK